MRLSLVIAMMVALCLRTATVRLTPHRPMARRGVLVVHVMAPGAGPSSATSDFVYPPDAADDLSRILPSLHPQADLLDRIPWLTAQQRDEVRSGDLYFL